MTIDWTINIGHLLTAISALAGAVALYFRIDKKIALIDQKMSFIEEDVAEVKHDTKQLKTLMVKQPVGRKNY